MRHVVTDKELRQLIMTGMLIAGPAFWMCLLFYGKRLFRREGDSLVGWIFLFNYAAFAITGLAYELF